MYGFTEINETTQNIGHSLVTVLNDVILDNVLSDERGEFRTLSVTGRGILDRRIYSHEKKFGNHESWVGLNSRRISVKFKLSDDTSEGFRERFNRLNHLLVDSKQKLEFTDEEAIYFATVETYDNPEEDSNDIIGVITFVCNDPFKYSHEKQLTTPTSRNIEGHKSTIWRTRTEFTSNQTGYTLQFNSPGKTDLKDINKIVLNGTFRSGDILEIDYKKRRITLNGKDISNQLVIMQSNYMELPIGSVEFEASHKTELFYHERYY